MRGGRLMARPISNAASARSRGGASSSSSPSAAGSANPPPSDTCSSSLARRSKKGGAKKGSKHGGKDRASSEQPSGDPPPPLPASSASALSGVESARTSHPALPLCAPPTTQGSCQLATPYPYSADPTLDGCSSPADALASLSSTAPSPSDSAGSVPARLSRAVGQQPKPQQSKGGGGGRRSNRSARRAAADYEDAYLDEF